MGNCPNNILEARQASGLSQKAVAITLGVSAPTVSDWEHEKKYPTAENLKQLSDLFSVSTDYLLHRSNSPLLGKKASFDWDGSFLVELRMNAGESPEYIAEAIGISTALYSQYESSILEPTISDLLKLADHFCTDVDLILRRYFYPTESGKIVTGDFRTSASEQHLIECYRSATQKEQDIIDGILREYQKKDSSAKSAV